MSATESRISPHVFMFAPFALDVTNQRLAKDGATLFLTPKAFSLLRYLIEHANRLVTKQELLDVVWEEAIVGDAVIRVCMNEVRKALGDNPDAPRYIETVHRKGYRFIGDVQRLESGDRSLEESQKSKGKSQKSKIEFLTPAPSPQHPTPNTCSLAPPWPMPGAFRRWRGVYATA